MTYKNKIQDEIKRVTGIDGSLIVLERPKIKEHGDIATNIAMKLAKDLKKSPLDIANDIKDKVQSSILISHIEIAKPGFINITVNDFILIESLIEVFKQKENFGLDKNKSKGKVVVEYVSANPTGDLHIGHGRQAALGDSLAGVLKAAGYDVSKEFYINDYGEQIQNLSSAAWELYKKTKGEKYEWKEEFYPEETLLPYLNEVLIEKSTFSSKEEIGSDIKNLILNKQKELLKMMNVNFDVWFSETNLHKSGVVDETLNKLIKSDFAYESEGAIWFRAKDFGDVRDRVLKRSDGRPTYLLADVAYHLDKLNRGNEYLINVWGADHHGQEVGLKGCLKACGVDEKKLEIVFVQLVSLRKDNQEVKMSKRAGTVVTVQEVLEEVGSDAFRYFLLESHSNNRMVFDIELAKKQDKDNPVFYIQYAHARCCSIFRQVENLGKEKEQVINILISEPKKLLKIFEKNNQEYNATKSLILKILDFPEEILTSAENRSPGKIANYLKDLANEFHQFYTVCRVISDDKDLTDARLSLVEATRIIIANGLRILGISAPESM